MFKRIGGAIALVILVTALFGLGTGQYRSWLRDLDYSQTVHDDESSLTTGPGSLTTVEP